MLGDGGKVELTGLDGLLVYRDHDVKNLSQFYYTSARPRVARLGTDWQLSFVEYRRPSNGSAGALSCIVDLQPSDAELTALDCHLRERCGGPVTPTPIPWTAGSVTAVFLGGMPMTSVPSLIGPNSTLVKVDLSTEQYVQLQARLQKGDPNIISMAYSLSYDVLRTAYQGRIRLDQEKFRSWAQTRCSLGLLVLDIEWSETFEELRSAGAILVEIINSTDAEYPQLRAAFMRSLEAIMGAEPQFARRPGKDPGWVLGFSCEKLSDEQRIQRMASVDLQVQAAESRTMFLQAPLDGLIEACQAMRGPPIDLNIQFMQQITFRCIANFDTEYLHTLVVSVSGATQRSNAFDAASPEDWQVELTYAPRTRPAYDYRCDLFFADGTVISGNAVPIARAQTFIFLVAAEYFTLQRYSVEAADDFPWQVIKAVRVTVAPPAAGKALPATVELGDTQRSSGVDLFVHPAWAAESLPYTALHAPSTSGRPFKIDGQSVGTTIFLNGLEKREVEFQADEAYDWTKVERVDVDVRTQDGALTAQRGVSVQPGASNASTFTYWYWKPQQLALSYRVTYNMTEPPTRRAALTQNTTDTLVALAPPSET